MSAPTFLKRMKFRPQVEGSLCIRCGACAAVCGSGAIAAGRGGAPQTRAGLCRNCRRCLEACDQGAIVIASWFDAAGSKLPGGR